MIYNLKFINFRPQNLILNSFLISSVVTLDFLHFLVVAKNKGICEPLPYLDPSTMTIHTPMFNFSLGHHRKKGNDSISDLCDKLFILKQKMMKPR